MCGIVGYIGNKKAYNVLLEGLFSLEYRGYDSAGIATLEKDKIVINKEKGRVKNLTNLQGISNLEGNIGIAHTRWATHGKPSKENAHPHIDNFNMFAVVHNGIIENYNELREFLIQEGYEFLSETDSEVIPNLIHYYFVNSNKESEDKLIYAIKSAIEDLKGSYAIQVLSPLYPDIIVALRKDSPLVIGKSYEESYIASDIPAILKYTNQFYTLEDKEIAIVYKDKIKFLDNNLKEQNKTSKTISWDFDATSKAEYKDYMLKEIFEQPKAIRETIGSRINLGGKCEFEDLNISKEYLESLDKIYIVACGTAMHAGLATKKIIEKLCRINVEVDIASEFRYREPIITKNTLCIYISQSGETADTLAALKLAKLNKAKTIAICNVMGSSITQEADYTIYTHAGPEIAVASTIAYTSHVVLLSMLAIYFAEILELQEKEYIDMLKNEILDLPKKVEECLTCAEKIKSIAKEIYSKKDLYFLGRGLDYATAQEASLKLKEISYIHSEAYASGELKHGPIALIESLVTVIAIITNENLVEKSVSNIQEVIARGASVIVITNQELDKKEYHHVINIPKVCELFSPIIAIVPLQLLSYYIAKNKGLDVDKPRNLAKSVTVE